MSVFGSRVYVTGTGRVGNTTSDICTISMEAKRRGTVPMGCFPLGYWVISHLLACSSCLELPLLQIEAVSFFQQEESSDTEVL